MKKQRKDKPPIQVVVTFTDGYEQRFTQAVLKMLAKRLQKENKEKREAG